MSRTSHGMHHLDLLKRSGNQFLWRRRETHGLAGLSAQIDRISQELSRGETYFFSVLLELSLNGGIPMILHIVI